MAQSFVLEAPVNVGDKFGSSLAISKNHLFVSAPFHDEGSLDAGAVFVFERKNSQWKFLQKLVPPNPSVSMNFGYAMDATASTLVIGAPGSGRQIEDRGDVYVFQQNREGKWIFDTHLAYPLPSPQISASFGSSVNINHNQLWIGAPGAFPSGHFRPGAIFSYVKDPNNASWQFNATLRGLPSDSLTAFGEKLKVINDQLVVAARKEDLKKSSETGRLLYIDIDPKNGRVQSPASYSFIEFPAEVSPNTSTSSFAIQGNLLALGNSQAKGKTWGTGSIYLFTNSPMQVEPLFQINASDGASQDQFGHTFVLNKDKLYVGAPGRDGISTDEGAVYVFEQKNRTSWLQIAKIKPPIGTQNAEFGHTLISDDSTLIVGAPGASANNSASGSVYIYRERNLTSSTNLSIERFSRLPRPRQVSALAFDQSNFLWVGTWSGLYRFDGYDFAQYSFPETIQNKNANLILKLLRDSSDRLWIGTNDGLFKYSEGCDCIRKFTLSKNPSSNEAVVAILETRAGEIWTGTNGQIYSLDDEQDHFIEYKPFTGEPDNREEPYISGIQEDKDGLLWVLSKNLNEIKHSLYKIDRSSDRVVRYTFAPSWKQIGPLLIDSKNRMWVNASEPLHIPENPNELLKPTKNQIAATPWYMFEDREGEIWYGTQKGVYQVKTDGRTLIHQLTNLTSQSNFVTVIEEDSSGRILLGGLSNIYYIDKPALQQFSPSQNDAERELANILITEVQISNPDSLTVLRYIPQDALILSHRDYKIDVQFAALTYTPVGYNTYRYKLDGYDRDWIEAGPDRRASYSNLHPGSYAFMIEATDHNGAITANPRTLKFVMMPPFWNTWWFRACVALLLIVVLTSLYRMRVTHLLQLERLRLRIAGDLHDDLGSNLSGIALLSDILGKKDSLDQDTRQQLINIASTSQKMVNDLRDTVWFINPGKDKLENLLLKMKDAAAILLVKHNYTFDHNGNSQTQVSMEFRRHVFLIFKEILHNIIRHADAKNVDVDLELTQNRLTVRICDDGIGFNPTAIVGGHGLASMKQRVNQLKGEIAIESKPGDGTTISFSTYIA